MTYETFFIATIIAGPAFVFGLAVACEIFLGIAHLVDNLINR